VSATTELVVICNIKDGIPFAKEVRKFEDCTRCAKDNNANDSNFGRKQRERQQREI